MVPKSPEEGLLILRRSYLIYIGRPITNLLRDIGGKFGKGIVVITVSKDPGICGIMFFSLSVSGSVPLFKI